MEFDIKYNKTKLCAKLQKNMSKMTKMAFWLNFYKKFLIFCAK